MKQIYNAPTQEAAKAAWTTLQANGKQVFPMHKKLEDLAGTHRILSSFPWSRKIIYTTILIENLNWKNQKSTPRNKLRSLRVIAR